MTKRELLKQMRQRQAESQFRAFPEDIPAALKGRHATSPVRLAADLVRKPAPDLFDSK